MNCVYCRCLLWLRHGKVTHQSAEKVRGCQKVMERLGVRLKRRIDKKADWWEWHSWACSETKLVNMADERSTKPLLYWTPRELTWVICRTQMRWCDEIETCRGGLDKNRSEYATLEGLGGCLLQGVHGDKLRKRRHNPCRSKKFNTFILIKNFRVIKYNVKLFPHTIPWCFEIYNLHLS